MLQLVPQLADGGLVLLGLVVGLGDRVLDAPLLVELQRIELGAQLDNGRLEVLALAFEHGGRRLEALVGAEAGLLELALQGGELGAEQLSRLLRRGGRLHGRHAPRSIQGPSLARTRAPINGRAN